MSLGECKPCRKNLNKLKLLVSPEKGFLLTIHKNGEPGVVTSSETSVLARFLGGPRVGAGTDSSGGSLFWLGPQGSGGDRVSCAA